VYGANGSPYSFRLIGVSPNLGTPVGASGSPEGMSPVDIAAICVWDSGRGVRREAGGRILGGSLRLFRNVPMIPACFMGPRTAKGGRKASLRAAKGGPLLGGPDLARPRPAAFSLPDKRVCWELDLAQAIPRRLLQGTSAGLLSLLAA
jgi:hypothetical protein